MSKNLKELKKIFNDSGGDYKIKQYVILMLEEHEKQVNELTKRVKRLEQAQTYYPMEHSKINGLMKLAELIKYQDRGND